MRIDYVIVAYRSEGLLAACLDAIDADRAAGSLVIVVDNASPDRSAEVARSHPSQPSLVTTPTNDGFGAGCNAGAAASSADALFFVNPDAKLRRGASATLAGRLEADPQTAVVGPRILDPRGEVTAAHGGAEPSLRSGLGHFLKLARLPVVGRWFPPLQLARADREAEPDWVSGAAMLIRRAAFDAVGGFDRRIFLYMEDVDLCRRVREAGWRIRYEPAGVVEHDIGGSQSNEQPARWYRAFHRYVLERRGALEARATAVVAAIGFLGRATVQARSRPTNARRMLAAGRTALALAFGVARPAADRPAR